MPSLMQIPEAMSHIIPANIVAMVEVNKQINLQRPYCLFPGIYVMDNDDHWYWIMWRSQPRPLEAPCVIACLNRLKDECVV